jgi:hypothetical protein
MKLWCYNDAHNWGVQLASVAQSRGHDVHVFDNPRQPDDGLVFMHMQHHPQVRLLHKRSMEIMSMNPSLTLIPDIRAATLFDDKIRQVVELSRWMPRTSVFYTPTSARKWIERQPKMPFISKSSEGASSQGVRLVLNYEDARNEIRMAFSDIGITTRYQQTQRGYLLWQEFIEGCTSDLRVIAIGGQRIMLHRGNRKDSHITPGTGNLINVRHLDEDVANALKYANQIFAEQDTRWGCLDLLRLPDGKWTMIETTVSWTLHGFYESGFFRDGQPTGKCGDKIWDVLVDEIEAGAFS